MNDWNNSQVTFEDIKALCAKFDEEDQPAEAYRHELTPDGWLLVKAEGKFRRLPRGARGWIVSRSLTPDTTALLEKEGGRAMDGDLLYLTVGPPHPWGTIL